VNLNGLYLRSRE